MEQTKEVMDLIAHIICLAAGLSFIGIAAEEFDKHHSGWLGWMLAGLAVMSLVLLRLAFAVGVKIVFEGAR